jgi:hypothetical protein
MQPRTACVQSGADHALLSDIAQQAPRALQAPHRTQPRWTPADLPTHQDASHENARRRQVSCGSCPPTSTPQAPADTSAGLPTSRSFASLRHRHTNQPLNSRSPLASRQRDTAHPRRHARTGHADVTRKLTVRHAAGCERLGQPPSEVLAPRIPLLHRYRRHPCVLPTGRSLVQCAVYCVGCQERASALRGRHQDSGSQVLSSDNRTKSLRFDLLGQQGQRNVRFCSCVHARMRASV